MAGFAESSPLAQRPKRPGLVDIRRCSDDP